MRANGMNELLASLALAAGVTWADPNPAADYSWNQDAANKPWTNGPNWTPAAPVGGPNGAGLYAALTNNITVNRTVTLTQTVAIGRMDIGDANGTHAFTIGAAGSGTLAFDGNGGSAVLMQTANGTSSTINVNMHLATSLYVTNANAYNLTLGFSISGPGGITVNAGTGSVQVSSGSGSGSNTFAGGFALLKGTLGNLMAAQNGNSVVSGGALVAGQFGTGTFTLGNEDAPVILIMGTSSSGTRQLCNNLVLSGDVTFQGPYKFILNGAQDAGGNLMTTPSTITLTRTNRLTLNNVSGSANVELRAPITGNYGITRAGDGAGILVLGTNNTFTGDTRIESGTIQLGNPLALQNSTFDTSGSTNLTFGSGVSNCTFGGLKGTNDLTLPAIWTDLTLNAGSGASLPYTGRLGGGKTTAPYLSVIKTGPGTQFLDGTNTYRGVTTVMAGHLGGNGVISNNLVMAGGGFVAQEGKILKVSGNLDLSATNDSLMVVGATPSGKTVVLTYTGTRNGTFDILSPGLGVVYDDGKTPREVAIVRRAAGTVMVLK